MRLALKGRRARGERLQKRGVNISLLSALSLRGVAASINIYGPVHGVTFEAFIVRKLVPNLWKGARVVIDNAKIHFGEMVKNSIENAGATLIYLSPYSPEFSPIENFWSKVKSILIKLKARNYADLIDAITDAMLQVTQKDIRALVCSLLLLYLMTLRNAIVVVITIIQALNQSPLTIQLLSVLLLHRVGHI